jgi:4-amino-4-deoxy-L-arabinose transferase-like glycosyltransferase
MKNRFILIIILLISLALRFYRSTYPPLLWDEAALGYNAYSILKTGKDEYGQTLPLIFKSFGDYKPGLYIYLTLPFVGMFGLSEASTRLPSIILGSLTPILVYALIKLLSPKFHSLPLIAATILALNPYNIHFSRAAWETNILTFELVFASVIYFLALKKDQNYLFLISGIVFGLSLFTYQAAKLISPLLIISLLISTSKIKHRLPQILLFLLPLFVSLLPVLWGLIFSQNANRLQVISLLSYPRSGEESQLILSEGNKTDYAIFHSQPIFFSRNFISRYFNHFSPRFLAFEGDWQNLRHSAPYIGVLLYPSLLFFLVGFFYALSNLFSSPHHRAHLFFFLWLLFAPLPAALTRDSIQSVRAMSLSIPLVYFTALGISQVTTFIISLKLKLLHYTYYFFLITGYFVSLILYLDLYHYHLLPKIPSQFVYGYQPAMKYLIDRQSQYQNLVFTNFYGQAYIYYLFYSHYPPADYQRQAQLTSNSLDTGTVEHIDKIKFSEPNFQQLKTQSSVLAIFSYDEIIRQGIDRLPEFSQFIPLSPIGQISTFYAYHHP